jgi:hypothetical protein
MRLTFAWLLAQLRLMIAHLAIGGTVYLLAYVLMTTFSIELMSQLGSVGCDAFFLIGACASYVWCNVSSHRHRPAGSAGGSL